MHGAYKYKMYLASLDVKTAFDVVKPGIIAEILKETGGHEWMSAALLAGGDEEPQGKGMSNLARRNADTHDVSGKEARKVPSG